MGSRPVTGESNTLHAIRAGAQKFIEGDRSRMRLYGLTCGVLLSISIGLFVYLMRESAIGAVNVSGTLTSLLTFLGSGIPILPIITLRNRVAGLEAIVAMVPLTAPNSEDEERLKRMFFALLSHSLRDETTPPGRSGNARSANA